MAWGPDANTEEELEKLAAVRAYFQREFPTAEISNSYDRDKLAQVFRIELADGDGVYDAVLLTELLDTHPPAELVRVFTEWRVAHYMPLAKGKEVVVASWGVKTDLS